MRLFFRTALFFMLGRVSKGLSRMSMSSTTGKKTLFDFPVSNNGARCRIIAYKVWHPTQRHWIIEEHISYREYSFFCRKLSQPKV